MPTPSYNTSLKMGGTSTAFTNEATTKLTANTVYQVTNAAKQILDPAVAVTVEVDADGGGAGGYVTADPTTYTVDYCFGKVTFDADQGASALVRVSGSYLPTLAVAGARECAVADKGSLQETTVFGSAWRTRALTLQDFSGSLTTIEPLPADHDPGAGTKRFLALMRAGTPLLLEYRPGGAGDYFRGWVLLESADEKASLEQLLQGTVNFQGTAPQGAGQTESAVSGWGT